MKYCRKCGSQMIDDAVLCTNCGCAVDEYASAESGVNGSAAPVAVVEKEPGVNNTENNESTIKTEGLKEISGLKKAAKILMIVGTVATSLCGYLIPLAWCLPMTLSYCKKIKNGEEITTGFKVCSLIFVSTVAGILMLCDHDD